MADASKKDGGDFRMEWEKMAMRNSQRRSKRDANIEREKDVMKTKAELEAELCLVKCQASAKKERLEGLKNIASLQKDAVARVRESMFVEQENRVAVIEDVNDLRHKLCDLRISKEEKRRERQQRVASLTSRLKSTPWAIQRQQATDELEVLKRELSELTQEKDSCVKEITTKKALVNSYKSLPFNKFCLTATLFAIRVREKRKVVASQLVVIAEMKKAEPDDLSTQSSFTSSTQDMSQEPATLSRSVVSVGKSPTIAPKQDTLHKKDPSKEDVPIKAQEVVSKVNAGAGKSPKPSRETLNTSDGHNAAVKHVVIDSDQSADGSRALETDSDLITTGETSDASLQNQISQEASFDGAVEKNTEENALETSFNADESWSLNGQEWNKNNSPQDQSAAQDPEDVDGNTDTNDFFNNMDGMGSLFSVATANANASADDIDPSALLNLSSYLPDNSNGEQPDFFSSMFGGGDNSTAGDAHLAFDFGNDSDAASGNDPNYEPFKFPGF